MKPDVTDTGLARRIDELVKGKLYQGGKRVMTAEQLAEKLGVTPAALSKWRRKGKIDKQHLALVSRFFGVSIDYLLTGEYQWGETREGKAWQQQINALSPNLQRQLQTIADALVVADRNDPTGNED